MTNFDWLAKWALYSPDALAIEEVETSRTLSFSEANDWAERLVSFFIGQRKLQKGDRVAVLAENCLELVLLFSACQKSGLILVPLNYRLATDEIEQLCYDCMPLLFLASENMKEKIPAFLERLSMPIEKLLEVVACEPSNAHRKTEIQPADVLFILYTSGTTGKPKGVCYTHAMLFWNSINTHLRLDITTADRGLTTTPMFHTGGWNVILTPFLHHGASVLLLKKFDPALVNTLLEERQITMFMAVPTMLLMMQKAANFTSADMSSVRFFVVGGEPMPIPLIEMWHSKGVPIRQGYGLTEAGPSITSLHQDDAIVKAGSIGSVNFYVEYRIADEQGRAVPTGERGELQLKGEVVTPGYWRNPQATKSAFLDGYFRTGDIVTEDENGLLRVVDRIKNMYISGGENVYPAEVEKVLEQHTAIAAACVVAVPDMQWGEVGFAFVVVEESTNIAAAALKTFLKERLASYKIPKYFHFLEALPLSLSGKTDRKKLAEEAKTILRFAV